MPQKELASWHTDPVRMAASLTFAAKQSTEIATWLMKFQSLSAPPRELNLSLQAYLRCLASYRSRLSRELGSDPGQTSLPTV